MYKSRGRFFAWMFLFILVFTMLLSVVSVRAEGTEMEDSVSSYSSSSDANDVGNWIKSQRGLTGEQLGVASNTLSPLTNTIGYLVGGIVVIIFAGITLITALDLLYIAIPPVRNLLYKAGTDGTGAYTGGMPGGGYNRGGMGMMGMGGVGGASGGTAKPTQWVSDEAVQCAALMGGSAPNQAGGPMGPGAQPNAQVNTSSVITAYFKKRAFFLVVLAICVIILTSSALLGTGVNLAQWGIKLINIANGYIPK